MKSPAPLVASVARSSEESFPSSDDPRHWLCNTPLLNTEHPKIRLLAIKLTQLRPGRREKALACFEFIRHLPFGCVGNGTGVSSLVVLKRGQGDCHTKSTLFIALLRSLNIPARLRFVTLKPDFLHGILELGNQPVEHCCAEVWLDNRWLAVDSHVVDLPLARAATEHLSEENRALGYGIHALGQTDWDGHTASFGQFSEQDPSSFPIKDWGPYDDPHHFYSSTPYLRSKLGWASRMKWMLGAKVVNRRVNALRRTVSPDVAGETVYDLCSLPG